MILRLERAEKRVYLLCTRQAGLVQDVEGFRLLCLSALGCFQMLLESICGDTLLPQGCCRRSSWRQPLNAETLSLSEGRQDTGSTTFRGTCCSIHRYYLVPGG